MSEQSTKSVVESEVDPEEMLEVTTEADEDAERRAVVLRNGITWESFERFLKVFGKWYR